MGSPKLVEDDWAMLLTSCKGSRPLEELGWIPRRGLGVAGEGVMVVGCDPGVRGVEGGCEVLTL